MDSLRLYSLIAASSVGLLGAYAVLRRKPKSADALEREDWATQRERPPFLTWIALSWQLRPGVFEQQLRRREKFLQGELAREESTLRDVRAEVGHRFHEAVWMLSLTIQQIGTELRWAKKLSREIGRRAAARNPDYADKG